MAHRSFSDPRGREWQVWDVLPQPLERRDSPDRRASAIPDRRGQDDRRQEEDRRRRQRRSADDRRATLRQRSRLPRTYAEGWLCFECADEKRRLVPVPVGWDRFSDEQLSHLLDSARIARASAKH